VLTINDQRVAVATTYGDVAPGVLVAYVDSDGMVAIGVNGGRADERLGVQLGDQVRVDRQDGGRG
jgi:S-adenosylmethionine hydrolase